MFGLNLSNLTKLTKKAGNKPLSISIQILSLFDVLIVSCIFLFLIFEGNKSITSLLVMFFLSFFILWRTRSSYRKIKDKGALTLQMQLRLIISVILVIIPPIMLINLILGS